MGYRAYVVDKTDDGVTGGVRTLDEVGLPQGEVLIRVAYSSVNYKDGLACSATGRVVRNYPMTPGIDVAGTVVESTDSHFVPGAQVVAIGYDIGVSHPGGWAELARLPARWVLPLLAGLSAEEAMALGTAGFTAAQSVDALERHGVMPERGPVLVTGATGGVGSVAVMMLAKRGYTVAASTGKASEHDYLRELGASEILAREEVAAESTRPMESERWAAAVDPVGGATTAYLLRTTSYGGAVALSGLTGGTTVATTVFPFILRGVSLIGIDSVNCTIEERRRIWARCATDLKPGRLVERIARPIGLDGVGGAAEAILRGAVRGRYLVSIGS